MRGHVLDRLAARSTWRGDCLEWNGPRSKGYGKVTYNGRYQLAHRVTWQVLRGPIPAATPYVLHSCDNPACWYVEHLFLGTQADNMADVKRRGRSRNARKTHCLRGHPLAGTNLIVEEGRGRHCRTCKNKTERERRARQRERKNR